jgi:hypothetical protein
MSAPNLKQMGLSIDAETHRGLKMDAARWDSRVAWIVEGLMVEYLARPQVERERFVRSLGAP